MSFEREMGGKLGFGTLRLPTDAEGNIDEELLMKMVDVFLENGFSYFDTAYTYMNMQAEEALRRCLVERYPRERFFLADKLPRTVKCQEWDMVFEKQLQNLGVECFDFYMHHNVGKT